MTNAQNSEHPAVILEKQNLKPIESVTDEQGREIDKETKALRIDRKSEAIEAEAIAFSFLQAKHEVLSRTNFFFYFRRKYFYYE